MWSGQGRSWDHVEAWARSTTQVPGLGPKDTAASGIPGVFAGRREGTGCSCFVRH
jgi:hypothetical protein